MGSIGYLLIVLAGLGLGLVSARRWQTRVRFLVQTGGVLQTLLGRLGYTSRPMMELWRQLAQSDCYGTFSLVQATAAAPEDTPFAVAFGGAVERAVTAGELLPAGQELLLEFARDCGRYDRVRQEEQLRYYCHRLAQLEAETKRAAAVKGRLYPMLGLFGGVALALLLL